jgi:hypothetical protein
VTGMGFRLQPRCHHAHHHASHFHDLVSENPDPSLRARSLVWDVVLVGYCFIQLMDPPYGTDMKFRRSTSRAVNKAE